MNDYIFAVLGVVLITIGIICVLANILKNPFSYPCFIEQFDVSRKRKPDIMNYVDKYLIQGGIKKIQQHERKIKQWKYRCEELIKKSFMKNYREKQYRQALCDDKAYVFVLVRNQTRYKQKNYMRTAYKVKVSAGEFGCSYQFLVNRDKQLAEIGYECPLNDYNSKEQRKLMTKALRRQIMERDNFTCQICGKFMPDEVGLHIDHIIPVKKGGKSVPSNLQVLCSKCNGSKSTK